MEVISKLYRFDIRLISMLKTSNPKGDSVCKTTTKRRRRPPEPPDLVRSFRLVVLCFYMKFLSATLLSFTFLLIGTGCTQTPLTPLFEYTVKSADDTCPQGQKMSHTFTGAGFVESGCRDIAADAGKVCNSNKDCTNNCFVTSDYLDQLNCIDIQTVCDGTQ